MSNLMIIIGFICLFFVMTFLGIMLLREFQTEDNKIILNLGLFIVYWAIYYTYFILTGIVV